MSWINEQWKFVGVTYDYPSGIAKLWVNGVIVKSHNIGTIELATQYPIRIGLRDGDSRIFKGLIDDVRIYNRALSEAEVKQLYEFPTPKRQFIKSMTISQ